MEMLKNLNWKLIAMLALIAVGAWVLVTKLGGKMEGIVGQPASVKIGLYNWLIVGVMASLFILLLKYITAKWNVPGLTEAAHAI